MVLLQIKQVENKRYNIAIANGGAPKEMAELAKKIRDEFPEAKHFWEGEMDATLSTYIGSGVLRLHGPKQSAVADRQKASQAFGFLNGLF